MCVSVFVCLHMCTCGYACTVFKNSALSLLYYNTCGNITHTIAVIAHLTFYQNVFHYLVWSYKLVVVLVWATSVCIT